MPTSDPAILDTLSYSGLSEREMRERALASRPDLDLFEHELSFVRRRIVGLSSGKLTLASDKPTLVILPDGPATIESYDNFVERLQGRFNIVLVEIPGFGFSYPKHGDALGFEKTSQITAAAISDLPHRQIVLVGPCYQGLVAARIAELIPEQLDGLIIAQTGDFEAECTWSGDLLDPRGDLRRPFEGQVRFRAACEKATVDWWPGFVAGPKLPLKAFQEEARKVQRAGCCYALASLVQNLHGLDPQPELRPKIPTAIFWGLLDKSHAATNRRSIQRYAPHAHYFELDDVGHFTDLEAPEAIAGAALKLISEAVADD